MSKLTREIKNYMHDLKSHPEDGITASFSFPEEFIGFRGHFPGKPVLPGVCKIQAILCMIETAMQKTPKLKEVASAKFFAPITANEEAFFTVRMIPQGEDEGRAKAVIQRKDKKIAEIHLRVSF
ncbi:MAG TPA: hypothetical protein PLI09_09645 [Candidatus Hydrogenedentes bacterium]|nr:hypothetical protein [Candidatus Hydrogenedentota bacterium]